MKHTKRNTCRLCDSGNVNVCLPMPACPPVDAYRYANSFSDQDKKSYPMDVYQCSDCGHIQLLDIVDPDILFGNYIYLSSTSPDLDAHFSDYAHWLSQNIKNDVTPHRVLDIGCNDGLFLSKLRNFGYSVLGVDASKFCCSVARKSGFNVFEGFFNAKLIDEILASGLSPDIVTANNVFSHSDDLRQMANDIYHILPSGGHFIFEVSYALDTFCYRVIDYVYHEHLSYHSLKPLMKFLSAVGFEIVDVVRVQTKGGSIRVMCKKVDNRNNIRHSKKAYELEALESAAGLYSPNLYSNLIAYVNKKTQEVHSLIRSAKANNQIIIGYGASATATVLMRLLSIENDLAFIVDDNKQRQGRLSPAGHLPICSISALDKQDTFLCIVLAWRFWDQIVDKLKASGSQVTAIKPFNADLIESISFEAYE